MEDIYVNNEFKLSQDLNKPSIYYIEFPKKSKELIKSIRYTKQLNSFTINSDYKFCTFKATNAKTFNKFLSDISVIRGSKKLKYNCILKLIYGLSKQLLYLIQHDNKSFYVYSLENLIVVDDNKFIYLSNEHLMDINMNEQITFYYPFSQNEEFLSPELLNIKELPCNIHYKNIYYSLGYLIIYCIKGNIDFTIFREQYEIDKKDESIIDNLLLNEIEEIKGTKIYYFLRRCLDKDPIKRSLILI